MGKIRLFCLPYAGGSAAVYGQWKKYLENFIELCPVELKGRGSRIDSSFYENLEEAAKDIFESVKDKLDGTPFAIFGHSMGSVLAYALASDIVKAGYNEPVHLFFSGRYPPHIFRYKELIHLLPDEEFKNIIMKNGGTPEGFFSHPALAELFLPILRADYKILETMKLQDKEITSFSCDITVLNGKQDAQVNKEDLKEWQLYTKGKCRIQEYDGGHFFINEQRMDVIKTINESLAGEVYE